MRDSAQNSLQYQQHTAANSDADKGQIRLGNRLDQTETAGYAGTDGLVRFPRGLATLGFNSDLGYCDRGVHAAPVWRYQAQPSCANA